jgi:hypothetical protein
MRPPHPNRRRGEQIRVKSVNSSAQRQFNPQSGIQSAIGNTQWTSRNPQSAIRNRQFNRQSAIQSAIGNPQWTSRNPQSTIASLQSSELR